MAWKASQKIALLTGIALLAVGCSTKTTKKTSRIDPDTVKFGAKFQGRQFISSSLPMVSTARVGVNGKIANSRDFMRQIANVRAYSNNITARYAHTYGKLSSWVAAGANINELSRYGINARLMRGQDGYQNVMMTGYFIPVIKARTIPQGQFRHPIYTIPKGNKKYTRAEIYNGALAGKGLELAYSNSMLDNFLMEVQGSGFVDIGNGNLRHFAYGDKNGYSYTGIGRLLVEAGEIPKEKMSTQAIKAWAARNPSRVQSLLEQNRSFVYFRPDNTFDVKGSAGVPLVALASVASDTNIVPSGSVLLVEMPLIDQKGNWTGKHQLRLMVALDRGGAVKGQHFDLYQGIGDQAGHQAGHMKHFGRVWVLN
ncbi:murein transglycosylase A [Muribacter muris]|uniref:Membrane-bound lytic murein transglycosylase A n=1 Tax=Muribacter muris TaxID=67855 RepID=A0A4Y9JQQ4_9PAST|nr:murein transglycosylase A [Muribacter muris]MBF0786050.1 murein transglycosylase A [Muribacter muris]MBF0827361.1 murein transglycosylase A [Muribacter muris]TFV08134.1 murein transglycosylase A [Muribacter muris]